MTIEAMAEKLGTSIGSLSRIERDDQWPDRGFFERMTDVTNGEVTANDFLAGDLVQSNSSDAVNRSAA